MHETTKWTDYRVTLKDRIVEKAFLFFSEHGIKAVKMDDIARSLGISKRTLYEIYDNKEDLLTEVMLRQQRIEGETLRSLASRCSNVMEILLNIYYHKTESMRNTNPQFFLDLEKYPDVLKMLKADHEKTHEEFMNFMARGVKEGYFRPDVDYELVGQMLEAFSEYFQQKHLFKKYTLRSIFLNNVFITIRGVSTQKGINLLERLLQRAESSHVS